MSLTWKSRTFVATATASLLTAAGVVALANAASGDSSASPTSIPSASSSASPGTVSTADLERSLADLLAQADGLEAAVAAADAAALAADDNGGRRPAGVSDDPSPAPATGYGDDDAYDDHGDDDAYDDHGDDDDDAYDDDAYDDDDHDDDGAYDDHGDGDDD